MTTTLENYQSRLVGSTGFSVRILRDAGQVKAMRGFWEWWQTHPNTDLDHYLLVCQLRPNVRAPHVIVVSYDNEPRAMLVGRLEENYIAPTLGYLRPFRFPITMISVLHRGLLGDFDEETAQVMLESLHASLVTGDADVIELYHLDETSALLRLALRKTSRLQRDVQPQSSTHWEAELDRQTGMLQKLSAKHRYWIRRKARELETAFPARISYEVFPPGGDVKRLCLDLETTASTTYQRSLSAGFFDDLEHRERFTLFNSRNQLRAYILRVDNIPRAFCLGIVYKNVFYFSETGYDPAFRSFEVGTLIFLYMADELMKEGVSKLDFGFGQAFYKQRFGDHSWREQTLRLYSRSLKGFAALSCTECFAAATRAGQWVLGRTGILDKIKAAWRRRLAAKRRTDDEKSAHHSSR